MSNFKNHVLNTPTKKVIGIVCGFALMGMMQPAFAEQKPVPAKTSRITPQTTSSNPEFVHKYLAAEVAMQQGEFGFATHLFLELARQTRDARLAERAARSAAFSQQPNLALQAVNLWAELDPNSVEAQEASSQLLMASGNLKEAKPHIKRLLAREETRANRFLYLNTLLANQKDKNENLTTVKEFAAPYPTLAEAQFAIGHAAWLADKPGDAKKALIRANDLRPGWEPAAQMHGQVLLKESPKQALDFYAKFLKKYPKADEVRLANAKLLVNQKMYTEAKPELAKITDNAKSNAEVSVMAGLLASESKDNVLADKYYQQALDRGYKQPEQVYLYLGSSAERQKNDVNALTWYDKVKEGEHYLPSRIAKAYVIARTQNTDAAIAMLDDVNDLTMEQQTQVIISEADLLNRAKRSQEAYDLLNKAVQNMGNSPSLIYEYAIAAERVGKLDIMEAELNKAIKMKPDYAAAYNALGYSYADRNIKLVEAKNLIETALKLSPGDHYMLDSLGWVHYRLGNLNEAVKYLRQAYEVQADPEIAAHLGEVLWKQGQQVEAQKIWESALKENPENDTLLATAKKFKS